MAKITSDRIMRLSTPEWQIPKARVLIRDDGTAAVFTSQSGPPAKILTITEDNVVKRTLTTPEGPVKYRAVGSSCSWPLAKCRQSTSALSARWPQT